MIVKGKNTCETSIYIVLLTKRYNIHVKTVKNLCNTSLSPVLKAMRKIAISSIFEGFRPLQNKNFSPSPFF